jgi:hypothetical protein
MKASTSIRWCLLGGAIAFAASTACFAQEPKVRATLDVKDSVFVGQRVTIVVELLAPGLFAGSAAFDLPVTPGMVLVPPRGSPVVGNETIDDVEYTSQRHELSAFAHRTGQQTIPPFTVRFAYKRQPLDKQTVKATVTTASLKFTAQSPPGAENLGGVISAKGLTASEKWTPEPGKAKVGDAFTRSITFAAPDIPAMAFPPFPAAKIDGLGVYPQSPEVLDSVDRGNLQGRRTDSITYVCQRPGTFEIPAARLSWFDLESKQLQSVDFPARTLVVAANPALAVAADAADLTADRASRDVPGLRDVAIALGVIVAAIAAVLYCHRRWSRWMAPFRPVHLAPLNPGPVIVKN